MILIAGDANVNRILLCTLAVFLLMSMVNPVKPHKNMSETPVLYSDFFLFL